MIFVIFGWLAAQLYAGLLLSVYPLVKHWDATQANKWLTSSVAAQFIFSILMDLTIFIGVYFLFKWSKAKAAVIGLRRPRWSDLLYGLAAAPLYYSLLILVLAAAKQLFPGLNLDQQQQLGFENVAGTLPLAMTFVSLVILPPLAEEILMRGIMYGSLKRVLPTIWAVLITSIVFAAGHLPEGGSGGPLYVAALDTFILSLVLIWLREKTNGLWACITLHALKNGIAFVALFVLHAR